MRRAVGWLAKGVEAVLLGAVAITVSGIVILVFLDVVYRYVTESQTYWNSEVARLLLIWMTYLGCAVLIRHRGLIRIDFVTSNRAGRHVRWIELVSDLVTAVVLGFIAAFSRPLLDIAVGKIAPATGWSYQFYYACLPVFAACGLLFILDRFLNGPQPERGLQQQAEA